MSGQHTQGLLRVKISVVLGDAWLLPAGATEVNRMREVALVNDPEDARRLAACWNVCDGVSTEHIEAMPDGGVGALAALSASSKGGAK